MQGLAFKSTIAALLVTAGLSTSFATSTNLTHQDMQNRGNSTTAAGCMGCHQGETEAMPIDQAANSSDHKKNPTDQKQSSTPTK